MASIVHGNIQHSRNTSFAGTPITSPLTPQIIAEAGGLENTDELTMAEDQVGMLPSLGPQIAISNPTHIKGHSPSASAAGDALQLNGTRRPERMHSGKARKEHMHSRSQSRHHPHQETQTVGEYALHHLFNSFVAFADQKINQCLGDPRYEPRVETICGPGIDSAFDQLISALGHIAGHKPKPLIDTIMIWRQEKREAAAAARANFTASAELNPPMPADLEHTFTLQQEVITAERKSTVSIYLLCRVLMEIFAQSTLADITPDMADRLESIIYKQLSSADPEYLEGSPFRQSNWVIFGQLLGAMSELDFDNVSRRFLDDLEKMQLHLVKRDVDGKAVLVIRGMRWLKMGHLQESSWNRTCDFLLALSKFSAHASGQSIKYAFNTLFKELLLPLVASATSEFNTPKWKLVIEAIKPKVAQMLAKPKHWHNAFPAMAVILCASPHESFASSWLSLIMPLQTKLKERSTRPAALRGICRLVWTYLYRTADTPTTTIKNLNEVVRLVFIPGKRSYISTDAAIAEPLIQLIRIIGYKYQDFCFRTIIFPLMNSDMFTSGKDLRIADLEPEKIVVGIRAFLAVMADLEKGEQPPFPVSFESDPSLETFTVSSMPLSPNPMAEPSRSVFSKQDRLSRPVLVSNFADVTKESYNKFCKILGEITILCDNVFGGQAVLDEKFSSQTPKTPMAEAFSFGRRDDHGTPSDSRQGFYDLLHVAVQALPRCLSPHISFKSLINLLCTGTAHVQSNIAASSAQSLKAIARQSHAQQITISFARFIFNFDDRYSTMSDGGMLGPDHIESTLRLYVELLHIWIEEIKQKTKRVAADHHIDEAYTGNRGVQLDLSGIWAHVDEVESHGLFFLCSPSPRVRTVAVTVLRLVTEFDTALGKDSPRVIKIVEGSPQGVIDINEEKLSVAERSRLQRGMRNNTQSTLAELCSSDLPYDATLWFKIFPSVVRMGFELCPFAATLTREIICARISQMLKVIVSLAEGHRNGPFTPMDLITTRGGARLASTAPDMVIEQWKLYLIFACMTLTNIGPEPAANQPQNHTRKSSKSSQQSAGRVISAKDLFNKVIPFLAVTNTTVRDAVVKGLGSINKNLYRTLLEALQPAVVNCNDEAKVRMANHQRTMSNYRGNPHNDYLRTEIAHVYKLTSHFLRSAEAYNDEWILNNLVNYTKDLRLFLNDTEVQAEWKFQKLRTHYCGLMEELYAGINKTKDPIRWMPFQSRKAAFTLMEDWCGFSPNQPEIRQREESMRRSMLDHEQEHGHKGVVTAAMEIEKRDLRTAALSAMATLCGGPVSITTDSKTQLSFNVARMLAWIDMIFETLSDKSHAIGRRALKNLILHNAEYPPFLGRSVEMCYIAKSPKALESYFEVVNEVITESKDFAPSFYMIICAALYTLGNENNQLRIKAARLLRTLEERQQKSSKLQDLDISISDKTIAVYKRAQFETSQRLAQQHSELAFHVFSEFCRFFKDLKPDHQRNMVAAMLPWVQTIELQVDPNGGPTGTSYMLLVNLFEITVRCGNALHNEIQALWQALAAGPHAGNVQLVLDFIINICLERKEQNFVDYAKQIVVYLAGTPAGSKVVEFLLLQITPKAMVQDKEKRQSHSVPQQAYNFPYLAKLQELLPGGNKQKGFSLGQLCLILLVDLMVSPMQLSSEYLPLLLQVVLILWDAHIPLVQDQAREMLVHLIHELVISQIDDSSTLPTKREIEDLIDAVRRHDPKVVWAYDDLNGKADGDNSLRVPEGMVYVATQVYEIFSKTYPGIQDEWSKTSLSWASNCTVTHLACRSFQLFRCILSTLDSDMLADMLIRLSNTIAHDDPEVQRFSTEILMSLKKIIDALAPEDLIQYPQYPQLFWATVACLDTIHEREFVESIAMLEKLMDKLDLSDPVIVKVLIDDQPPSWQGPFEGLQTLVCKGVRSSLCLNQSLRVLEKLAILPSNDLVGDGSCLLFTILANLPRYLQSFEEDSNIAASVASAATLAKVADSQLYSDVAKVLHAFSGQRYRKVEDFISQILQAIRSTFFPDHEYKCLIFLMSLLTNKLPWFKIRSMELLSVFIPAIDMRKPEIATKGPDLITPLLRLLQTEFCPQALGVLDKVMAITATPTDYKHIRMSMYGAHTSRAVRKEFDKTQSLYGIPEESGWSIPIPSMHAQNTRHNLHAVFYMCAGRDVVVTAEDATPKIELVADDYTGSYFQDYRTATMMSDDTRGDGHMGDLVMKLESLDDFFDDDNADTETGSATSPSAHHFPSPTVDAREDLYDQQTFPILNKSLMRKTSVSSFQNGFVDTRMSPSREAMIMTPGAFTTHSGLQHPHPRPTLHARSVTSPGVQVPHHMTPFASTTTLPASSSFSFEETLVDDPFSEDEGRAPGMPHPGLRTHANTFHGGISPGGSSSSSVGTGGPDGGKFSIDNMLRQPQSLRSGLRSGIRRLTGGGGDAREAARAREALRLQTQRSPRVPKVPDVFLQNPKSSEI
ncbi:hypothetical protein EJ06DRAFT_524485 [Trichodelitschia bisporula]|uniref:Cell morphogenesis protein-like protein n=1 Tax=Trichodelitschia bisporula TaxID=703511 RepID=A0A6G1HKI4_9PEZI|nr:hypothetical protein EJ06DRAFT_524485 [Trichodelitschia bisporula]